MLFQVEVHHCFVFWGYCPLCKLLILPHIWVISYSQLSQPKSCDDFNCLSRHLQKFNRSCCLASRKCTQVLQDELCWKKWICHPYQNYQLALLSIKIMISAQLSDFHFFRHEVPHDLQLNPSLAWHWPQRCYQDENLHLLWLALL